MGRNGCCWQAVLLLLLAVVAAQGNEATEIDDYEYLADVRRLYEEPQHYMDPNDMLLDDAAVEVVRRAGKLDNGRGALLSTSEEPFDEDGNAYYLDGPEKKVLQVKCEDGVARPVDVVQQLGTCTVHLLHATQQLQEESLVNQRLVKQQTAAAVDYEPYYHRTLQLLWDAMHLQSALSSAEVREDGVVGVVRRLLVTIPTWAVTALHHCLHNTSTSTHHRNPRECDEAVSAVLLGMSLEGYGGGEVRLLSRVWEGLPSLAAWNNLDVYSVELWLRMVGVLLIGVAVWALLLLLVEVVRHRRWQPLLILLLVLLFVASCLWNWRRMIKAEEARRMAQWQRLGGQVAAECRDASKTSWWQWLTTRDMDAYCQEQYRGAMTGAGEEVTPERVVAATIASFFLQPLAAVGKGSAAFFTQFFSNIPLVYVVPASCLLMFVFTVMMFMMCGYGIDFPLWMGGIRPIYRPDPVPTSTVTPTISPALSQSHLDAILAQLRAEQTRYLQESREMLMAVNSAVYTATPAPLRQHAVQPILASSYRSIESQLDQLISARLQTIINTPSPPSPLHVTPAAAGPDPQQHHHQHHLALACGDVHTPPLTPNKHWDEGVSGSVMDQGDGFVGSCAGQSDRPSDSSRNNGDMPGAATKRHGGKSCGVDAGQVVRSRGSARDEMDRSCGSDGVHVNKSGVCIRDEVDIAAHKVTHHTDAEVNTSASEKIPSEGAVIADVSDFYNSVCGLLGESFNSSTMSLDDSVACRTKGSTVRRRRVDAVQTDNNKLSPSSKKFLSQVKNIMD